MSRSATPPLSGSADVDEQLDSTPDIDPDPSTQTLIDHALEALAALSLFAITVMLFANAALRFFFDSPIGLTEELVTGLMLWLTMFGFTIGVRRRESIAVRAFVGRLPLTAQVWIKLATDLVTAVVLVHLAWFAYKYVAEFGGDPSPSLGLPRGYFTAALPIGAATAALIVLAQLPGGRAAILRQIREERE